MHDHAEGHLNSESPPDSDPTLRKYSCDNIHLLETIGEGIYNEFHAMERHFSPWGMTLFMCEDYSIVLSDAVYRV